MPTAVTWSSPCVSWALSCWVRSSSRSPPVRSRCCRTLLVVSGIVTVEAVTRLIWPPQGRRAVLIVAIASLIVVGLMLKAAWELLRDSGRVLLEAAPKATNLDDIRAHLLATDYVHDVHYLHAWTFTSGLPALSAHIVIDSLPDRALRHRALNSAPARRTGMEQDDRQGRRKSPLWIRARLPWECQACLSRKGLVSWPRFTTCQPIPKKR